MENNKIGMRSSKILKMISVCTLFCFLTETLFAQSPGNYLFWKKQDPEHLKAFTEQWMPSEIGRVEEYYGEGAPQIIFIQDAHGQYEAQKNIEAMLEWLNRKTGLSEIFLEGAFGKLEPNEIRFFKESDVNRRVLERLAQEAEIGGPELFLADYTREEKSFSGFGVENPGIYASNLKAYQKVMSRKKTSLNYLEQQLSGLKSRATQIMGRDLFAFFEQWLTYEQRTEKDFLPYLESLKKTVRKNLSISLDDARQQIDWPMMVRLFEIGRRDKLIDMDSVKKEKAELTAWASQKGLQGKTPAFWEDLGTGDAKSHGLSRRRQWENFYAAAQPRGFKFEVYPALTLFEGRRILEEEMDASLLFVEAERLRDLVFEKLARRRQERKLIEETRGILLLGKLLSLEMNSSEFEVFKKSRKGDFGNNPLPEEIANLVQDAISFYEFAGLRDKIMISNITLPEKGKPPAALIAGGFHTRGMTALLRNQGVAYLVASPRISEIEDPGNYESAMTGAKLKFDFRDFTVRQASWLVPIEKWKRVLRDPVIKRRAAIREMIRREAVRQGIPLTEETVSSMKIRSSRKPTEFDVLLRHGLRSEMRTEEKPKKLIVPGQIPEGERQKPILGVDGQPVGSGELLLSETAGKLILPEKQNTGIDLLAHQLSKKIKILNDPTGVFFRLNLGQQREIFEDLTRDYPILSASKRPEWIAGGPTAVSPVSFEEIQLSQFLSIPLTVHLTPSVFEKYWQLLSILLKDRNLKEKEIQDGLRIMLAREKYDDEAANSILRQAAQNIGIINAQSFRLLMEVLEKKPLIPKPGVPNAYPKEVTFGVEVESVVTKPGEDSESGTARFLKTVQRNILAARSEGLLRDDSRDEYNWQAQTEGDFDHVEIKTPVLANDEGSWEEVSRGMEILRQTAAQMRQEGDQIFQSVHFHMDFPGFDLKARVTFAFFLKALEFWFVKFSHFYAFDAKSLLSDKALMGQPLPAKKQDFAYFEPYTHTVATNLFPFGLEAASEREDDFFAVVNLPEPAARVLLQKRINVLMSFMEAAVRESKKDLAEQPNLFTWGLPVLQGTGEMNGARNHILRKALARIFGEDPEAGPDAILDFLELYAKSPWYERRESVSESAAAAEKTQSIYRESGHFDLYLAHVQNEGWDEKALLENRDKELILNSEQPISEGLLAGWQHDALFSVKPENRKKALEALERAARSGGQISIKRQAIWAITAISLSGNDKIREAAENRLKEEVFLTAPKRSHHEINMDDLPVCIEALNGLASLMAESEPAKSRVLLDFFDSLIQDETQNKFPANARIYVFRALGDSGFQGRPENARQVLSYLNELIRSQKTKEILKRQAVDSFSGALANTPKEISIEALDILEKLFEDPLISQEIKSKIIGSLQTAGVKTRHLMRSRIFRTLQKIVNGEMIAGDSSVLPTPHEIRAIEAIYDITRSTWAAFAVEGFEIIEGFVRDSKLPLAFRIQALRNLRALAADEYLSHSNPAFASNRRRAVNQIRQVVFNETTGEDFPHELRSEALKILYNSSALQNEPYSPEILKEIMGFTEDLILGGISRPPMPDDLRLQALARLGDAAILSTQKQVVVKDGQSINDRALEILIQTARNPALSAQLRFAALLEILRVVSYGTTQNAFTALDAVETILRGEAGAPVFESSERVRALDLLHQQSVRSPNQELKLRIEEAISRIVSYIEGGDPTKILAVGGLSMSVDEPNLVSGEECLIQFSLNMANKNLTESELIYDRGLSAEAHIKIGQYKGPVFPIETLRLIGRDGQRNYLLGGFFRMPVSTIGKNFEIILKRNDQAAGSVLDDQLQPASFRLLKQKTDGPRGSEKLALLEILHFLNGLSWISPGNKALLDFAGDFPDAGKINALDVAGFEKAKGTVRKILEEASAGEKIKMLQEDHAQKLRTISEALGLPFQRSEMRTDPYSLEEVLMTHKIPESLSDYLTPEIINALKEDVNLRPVFMIDLPFLQGAGEHLGPPENLDQDLLRLLGGVDLIHRFSGFLIGGVKDAEAYQKSGGKLLVGVTDIGIPNATHGRQAFFPLGNGLWLGVKGSGHYRRSEGPVFEFSQDTQDYRGLVVEEEVQNTVNFQNLLKEEISRSERLYFVPMLGSRAMRSLPVYDRDQKVVRWISPKEMNPPLKETPHLVFNLFLGSPHRLSGWEKWIKWDFDLLRTTRSLNQALHFLGELPEDKNLTPQEVMEESIRRSARAEAIKQNLKRYKKTIHQQDFSIFQEADNEEAVTHGVMVNWLKTRFQPESGRLELLEREGLESEGVRAKLATMTLMNVSEKYERIMPRPADALNIFFQGYFQQLNMEDLKKWARDFSIAPHPVVAATQGIRLDLLHPAIPLPSNWEKYIEAAAAPSQALMDEVRSMIHDEAIKVLNSRQSSSPKSGPRSEMRTDEGEIKKLIIPGKAETRGDPKPILGPTGEAFDEKIILPEGAGMLLKRDQGLVLGQAKNRVLDDTRRKITKTLDLINDPSGKFLSQSAADQQIQLEELSAHYDVLRSLSDSTIPLLVPRAAVSAETSVLMPEVNFDFYLNLGRLSRLSANVVPAYWNFLGILMRGRKFNKQELLAILRMAVLYKRFNVEAVDEALKQMLRHIGDWDLPTYNLVMEVVRGRDLRSKPGKPNAYNPAATYGLEVETVAWKDGESEADSTAYVEKRLKEGFRKAREAKKIRAQEGGDYDWKVQKEGMYDYEHTETKAPALGNQESGWKELEGGLSVLRQVAAQLREEGYQVVQTMHIHAGTSDFSPSAKRVFVFILKTMEFWLVKFSQFGAEHLADENLFPNKFLLGLQLPYEKRDFAYFDSYTGTVATNLFPFNLDAIEEISGAGSIRQTRMHSFRLSDNEFLGLIQRRLNLIMKWMEFAKTESAKNPKDQPNLLNWGLPVLKDAADNRGQREMILMQSLARIYGGDTEGMLEFLELLGKSPWYEEKMSVQRVQKSESEIQDLYQSAGYGNLYAVHQKTNGWNREPVSAVLQEPLPEEASMVSGNYIKGMGQQAIFGGNPETSLSTVERMGRMLEDSNYSYPQKIKILNNLKEIAVFGEGKAKELAWQWLKRAVTEEIAAAAEDEARRNDHAPTIAERAMALIAQAISELPDGPEIQAHEQFLKDLMIGTVTARSWQEDGWEDSKNPPFYILVSFSAPSYLMRSSGRQGDRFLDFVQGLLFSQIPSTAQKRALIRGFAFTAGSSSKTAIDKILNVLERILNDPDFEFSLKVDAIGTLEDLAKRGGYLLKEKIFSILEKILQDGLGVLAPEDEEKKMDFKRHAIHAVGEISQRSWAPVGIRGYEILRKVTLNPTLPIPIRKTAIAAMSDMLAQKKPDGEATRLSQSVFDFLKDLSFDRLPETNLPPEIIETAFDILSSITPPQHTAPPKNFISEIFNLTAAAAIGFLEKGTFKNISHNLQVIAMGNLADMAAWADYPVPSMKAEGQDAGISHRAQSILEYIILERDEHFFSRKLAMIYSERILFSPDEERAIRAADFLEGVLLDNLGEGMPVNLRAMALSHFLPSRRKPENRKVLNKINAVYARVLDAYDGVNPSEIAWSGHLSPSHQGRAVLTGNHLVIQFALAPAFSRFEENEIAEFLGLRANFEIMASDQIHIRFPMIRPQVVGRDKDNHYLMAVSYELPQAVEGDLRCQFDMSTQFEQSVSFHEGKGPAVFKVEVKAGDSPKSEEKMALLKILHLLNYYRLIDAENKSFFGFEEGRPDAAYFNRISKEDLKNAKTHILNILNHLYDSENWERITPGDKKKLTVLSGVLRLPTRSEMRVEMKEMLSEPFFWMAAGPTALGAWAAFYFRKNIFGKRLQPVTDQDLINLRIGRIFSREDLAEIERYPVEALEILEPLNVTVENFIYVIGGDDRLSKKYILKIARPGSLNGNIYMENEVSIMRRIQASADNRLNEAGLSGEGAIYSIMPHLRIGVWSPHLQGLVLPYLEGKNMHEAFLEPLREGGKENVPSGIPNSRFESLEQYLRIVLEMMDADAEFSNQNIVHRDLKPSNFFITEDGRIVLFDYNIASPVGELSPGLEAHGSPGFTSPQQWEKNPPAFTDDVFSMGMTLAILWLGPRFYQEEMAELMRWNETFPWTPKYSDIDFTFDIRKKFINPDTEESLLKDNPLRFIIEKALELHPAKRYSSVSSMAEEIRSIYEAVRGDNDAAARLRSEMRTEAEKTEAARVLRQDIYGLDGGMGLLDGEEKEVPYPEELFHSNGGILNFVPTPDGGKMGNFSKSKSSYVYAGVPSKMKDLKLYVRKAGREEKKSLGLGETSDVYFYRLTYTQKRKGKNVAGETVFLWDGSKPISAKDHVEWFLQNKVYPSEKGEERLAEGEVREVPFAADLLYTKAGQFLKTVPLPGGKRVGDQTGEDPLSIGTPGDILNPRLFIKRLRPEEKAKYGFGEETPQVYEFRLTYRFMKKDKVLEGEAILVWDGKKLIPSKQRAVQFLRERIYGLDGGEKIEEEKSIQIPFPGEFLYAAQGKLNKIFPTPDGADLGKTNNNKPFALGTYSQLKNPALFAKRLSQETKKKYNLQDTLEDVYEFRLKYFYVDKKTGLDKEDEISFLWDGKQISNGKKLAIRFLREKAYGLDNAKGLQEGEKIRIPFPESLLVLRTGQAAAFFPTPDGKTIKETHYRMHLSLGASYGMREVELWVRRLDARGRKRYGLKGEKAVYEYHFSYRYEEKGESKTGHAILIWNGKRLMTRTDYAIAYLKRRGYGKKGQEGLQEGESFRIPFPREFLFAKASTVHTRFPTPDGKRLSDHVGKSGFSLGFPSELESPKLRMKRLGTEEKAIYGISASAAAYEFKLSYRYPMKNGFKEGKKIFLWNGETMVTLKSQVISRIRKEVYGLEDGQGLKENEEKEINFIAELLSDGGENFLSLFPTPDGGDLRGEKGKKKTLTTGTKILQEPRFFIKRLTPEGKEAFGLSEETQPVYQYTLTHLSPERKEKRRIFIWDGSQMLALKKYLVQFMNQKVYGLEDGRGLAVGEEMTIPQPGKWMDTRLGSLKRFFPLPNGKNLNQMMGDKVSIGIGVQTRIEKFIVRRISEKIFEYEVKYIKKKDSAPKEHTAWFAWNGQKLVMRNRSFKTLGLDSGEVQQIIDEMESDRLLNPSEIRLLMMTRGWDFVSYDYMNQLENFAPFWWDWYTHGKLVGLLKKTDRLNLLKEKSLDVSETDIGERARRLYREVYNELGLGEIPPGDVVDLSPRMIEASEARDKREGIPPERRPKKIVGDMRELRKAVGEGKKYRLVQNPSLNLLAEKDRLAALLSLREVMEEGGLLTLTAHRYSFGEKFVDSVKKLGFEVELLERISLTEAQAAWIKMKYGEDSGGRIVEKIRDGGEFMILRKTGEPQVNPEDLAFPFEKIERAEREASKEAVETAVPSGIDLRGKDYSGMAAGVFFQEANGFAKRLAGWMTQGDNWWEALGSEREFVSNPESYFNAVTQYVLEHASEISFWPESQKTGLLNSVAFIFSGIYTDVKKKNYEKPGYEIFLEYKTGHKKITMTEFIKDLQGVLDSGKVSGTSDNEIRNQIKSFARLAFSLGLGGLGGQALRSEMRLESHAPARFEMRMAAAAAVASGMTNGILSLADRMTRLLNRVLQSSGEKGEEASLLSAKQEIASTEMLRKDFLQFGRALIPASVVMRAAKPLREIYFTAFAKSMREAGLKEEARIYFTGPEAAQLKEEISSYDYFKRGQDPAAIHFFEMNPQEESLAASQIKSEIAISLLKAPDEAARFDRPSFLIEDAGEDKTSQLIYLNRLTLLLLLASQELSEKLKGASPSTAASITAEFLTRLQIEFGQDPSGFLKPTIQSLLAETLIQTLEAAAATARSA